MPCRCKSVLCVAMFLSYGIFFVMTAPETGAHSNQAMSQSIDCRVWNSQIDPAVHHESPPNPITLSDTDALEAMNCLIKNRGNRTIAKIGGATNLAVSQQLPEPTVELAALYYISYIFTKSYQHADGIALWDDAGTINPPHSIESAYSAYITWLNEVRKVGVSKARRLRLDPLNRSGLAWYGKRPS